MIAEQVSGKEERRILMAMVVHKTALASIAAKWKPDAEMFRSKWANIVGALCVDYFKRYGKAPRRAMEPLFEAWATERSRDKETVAIVEKFLGGLSSEYEQIKEDLNGPHMVDLAGHHFNRVKLERLRDQIDGNLSLGKVEKATELVRGFDTVNLGGNAFVDVLQDEAALETAFEQAQEPLIILPGALGKFFGNSLKRGGFISLLAPEKVGKTTNLVALSWLCMLARLRVAFFSLGDESADEMMLRFAQRASRRPAYPERIRFPTAMRFHDGSVQIKHEERDFESGLSIDQAKETFLRIQKEKLHSKKSYLRLSQHDAGTLSVKGMDDMLEEWAREDWIADVVVGDYMELLDESGNTRDEPRFRISATWRDFRALCTRRRVLGLSATQANTAANAADYLTRAHFSESKTKLAHVTGMAGINQNDKEKEAGRLRLNWVVRRGAMFVSSRCCHCAGSFAVQNPLMQSLY